MNNNGYIKLYRKILDNPIVCKDMEHFIVWIYLLLNATHKEHDVVFKNERVTLKAGQILTGRKKIGQRFNIDENKVQRILKYFEKQHQIEQQMSSKNRLITIVNWKEYQLERQQIEQQVNNNRTTSEQQVNTNKNGKNIKKDKNVTTIVGDSCVDGLQEVIDFYDENIGMITPHGKEVLSDYEKELGKDIVIFAMKKAVEANIRTIAYIKGTLNNWEKVGVKTLIEAEKESRRFRNKNAWQGETEEEKMQRKIKALEEGLANDTK